MFMEKEKRSGLFHQFDSFFCLSCEQIEDNGEDSIAFSANENAVLVSSFDGCGGAGARRYPEFENKTGAYIASRAVSGAVLEWFHRGMRDDLESWIQKALAVCSGHVCKEAMRIKGDLFLEFPTTGVIAVSQLKSGKIQTDFHWAGDSRGYALLADSGLLQLTSDDVQAEGGEGLGGDERMTNVISATGARPWHLNRTQFSCEQPHLVITATDGCFAYMESPMEFEYVLLDTMCRSQSPREWENHLFEAIGSVAGDDYTFCAAAFGYCSFADMKQQFEARREYLYQYYIAPFRTASENQRRDLWLRYKLETRNGMGEKGENV